jgi:hypothetical protein
LIVVIVVVVVAVVVVMMMMMKTMMITMMTMMMMMMMMMMVMTMTIGMMMINEDDSDTGISSSSSSINNNAVDEHAILALPYDAGHLHVTRCHFLRHHLHRSEESDVLSVAMKCRLISPGLKPHHGPSSRALESLRLWGSACVNCAEIDGEK